MEESKITGINRNIEVQISGDGMTAYIKLEKPADEEAPATREEMLEALAAHGVTYGIREAVVEKLAATPVYAFRMEAAKGLNPISGENGRIEFHVKKDKEYEPEYTEEGTVDYKNIDYFQLTEKGRILCDIIAPGQGTDGMDVFGKVIPAMQGKEAAVPQGENTSVDDEGTHLIADCDGLVRFAGSRIDISEMLQIRSSVNNITGNVNFSGDITVGGDVCNGIAVKAGGNIIIRGVIEDATVEAGGSLHVMNGINGDGKNKIIAGGGLTCKYIENAIIEVDGSIMADYIIDSDIRCSGDIILTGTKEVLIGGSTMLGGELRVRDIGNLHERPTKIEFMGIRTIDERRIAELEKEQDAIANNVNSLVDTAARLGKQAESGRLGIDAIEQLISLKQQIQFQTEKAGELNEEIELLKRREFIVYPGFITCKRKIYQGVRIYFGDNRFQFSLDNIEHCRIYWFDDQIVQNTL